MIKQTRDSFGRLQSLPNKHICSQCGTTHTLKGKKKYKSGRIYIYDRWYHLDRNDDNVICDKCWKRQRHPVERRAENSKRLNVRINGDTKTIVLKYNPRIGVCSDCNRSIDKGEISMTCMYHLSFDKNNPLANTVELCNACMIRRQQESGNIDRWKEYQMKITRFLHERQKYYCTREWMQMRRLLLQKYNNRCQHCGKEGDESKGSGSKLHIHHIREWAKHPEHRFDMNNLLPLCQNCHRKTFKNTNK